MPNSNVVLVALKHELIVAGLVRDPDVAGVAPPAFIEPQDGAPRPGTREAPETDPTLMVTITRSSELSETRAEAYRRRLAVSIRYRSKSAPGLVRARALDAAIRGRLVDRADYSLGWDLGATMPNPVRVLEVTYGGAGPIGDDAPFNDERALYFIETLSA